MTPEEIEDLEVQEINDFTQIAAITGDENFPVQTPAGNNLACKAAQIASYAFPATCNTAATAATKVVVITGYHGTVLPPLVAVTFTYGNTYGDVTASSATHPYIQFKNADNVNLGNAKNLCDCLGNYAGTGCLKSGNIAILRTIGDKTLITNSDVRQQTDTYTIKADGSIEESKYTSISQSDFCNINEGFSFNEFNVYKHNNHVYGFVQIKNDSSAPLTTETNLFTIKSQYAPISMNRAMYTYVGNNNYSNKGVIYCALSPNQILRVNDNNSIAQNNKQYINIAIDYITVS